MSSTALKTISFARGVPSFDLIPADELRSAIVEGLEADGPGVLFYGDAAGYAPLRTWVAARYGGTADRVLLTNGSLQGLAFLAEHLFSSSGGRAVVEAPTYDRAILILRRFGATVEPIELQEDGLDVDALAAMCESGRVPGLVYVISSFQNPGGVTTSEAKRRRLVGLAAEHGFWLLEDDPYGELRFSGEPIPSMFSMDEAGRVIYSTSFTKTVAPGLRSGAMILPPELHAPLRKLALDTYIAPGHFAEAALAAYTKAGEFDRGLERIRPLLAERCAAMDAALTAYVGGRGVWVAPEGGYFFWVRLPGVDTDDLLARATTAGVPFVAGSSCYGDGTSGRDELRLSFASALPADIDEGIRRLAELL
jgi:2-aminoadipate transaminase